MGDMSSGGGMGKSASAMGAGAPADSSGGLGLGGGGVDPSMFSPDQGMGMPDLSGGTGSIDPGAFGFTAPQQLQASMQGGQPSIPTDQPTLPSAPAAGAPQAAPAPPPPPQLDKGEALFRGMSAHPEWGFNNQMAQGPSATPGPIRTAYSGAMADDPGMQQLARLYDPESGKTIPNFPQPTDPSLPQRSPSIELPELNQPSIELPELNQSPANVTGSRYDAGASSQFPEMTGKPSIEIPQNQPATGTTPPTATASQGPMLPPGSVPPTNTASRGPMLAQGAIPDNLKTGTADGGSTTPGATSQVTPPGTSAPAGAGHQSPLEQLVSGVMHGLWPLIARFLGINPRMFPQLFGGGFNRPVGPGYFPPGTVGGRGPISQGVPQTGPQTPPGSPPASPAPQSPQKSPSALPPPTRYTDTPRGSLPVVDPDDKIVGAATGIRAPGSLPGQGYTADRPDQPPPWYHGGADGAPGRVAGSIGSQIRIPQGSVAARNRPSGQPSQSNVDRSQFRSQLAQDPKLVARLAWMVNGEIGRGASTQQKIVQLETAFNRAQIRHIPLSQALEVHTGPHSRGYYAGETYSRNAMPSAAEVEQFKRDVLTPVMNGSNMSDVGWGPMTGNASNAPGNPLANRQFQRQLGYTFGKESYFMEDNTRGRLPTLSQ